MNVAAAQCRDCRWMVRDRCALRPHNHACQASSALIMSDIAANSRHTSGCPVKGRNVVSRFFLRILVLRKSMCLLSRSSGVCTTSTTSFIYDGPEEFAKARPHKYPQLPSISTAHIYIYIHTHTLNPKPEAITPFISCPEVVVGTTRRVHPLAAFLQMKHSVPSHIG